MGLQVKGLEKVFSPEAGAWDVSFQVEDGELLVLLGPSGCGKSTTLRMIAGLEEPDKGEVRIGGERITHLPANRRDVAFVFQRPTFLPHRTVAENIAYPLLCRDQRWYEILLRRFPEEYRDTAHRWARRLSVGHLVDRYPTNISGGEGQRVALARALVKDAEVLLLDEPLANIDVQLRHALRHEILQIRSRAAERGRGAMVYVTHDQDDALLLGDRVALMRDGRIVQIGEPADLYRNPADLFTARFLRSPGLNIVQGRLESMEDGALTVRALETSMRFGIDRVRWAEGLEPGVPIAVGFRVDAPRIDGDGRFEAPVREVRDLGHRTCMILEHDGEDELTVLTEKRPSDLPHDRLRFHVDERDLYVFDPVSERRIV